MGLTDAELKAVFCEAADLPAGPERDAYLDRTCPAGAPERVRVEALLRAHDASGRFLGTSPGSSEAPDPATGHDPGRRPMTESPGTRIGPFQLLRPIGEGGMGVVFEAEQTEPVRRTVALKVIKPGMDTEAVIARFEAERQALALMGHPNIARVFDAGTTDTGRPFFVMELVEGVPITDYCDRARLTLRQRLELFLPVCAAVQHAHQKGVIHRDLKPSNVLVTLVDGKPVPKVIDFGIAKAVDRRLTDRMTFTQSGAIVGTPESMSPEQAGASPDVDTRADVYALGVLLYELLTGTTPLDRETLRRAAFDEVLRRVKEEEPPKPSTRLSGSGDRLPSVAAQRDTEPSRLSRMLRGDLDWVVMKSLEKDRARRYETPSAFARDVQRHLDGDPVEAVPPSRAYRLRKFAHKHRAALATAGTIALVLVAAAGVSAWAAWRASRAEAVAEKRLGEVRHANEETMAALAETKKAEASAREALKQSEEDREQADSVSHFMVDAFRRPSDDLDGHDVKVVDVLVPAAASLEAEFASDRRLKGALHNVLGETFRGLGLYKEASEQFEKGIADLRAARGPDHPDTLNVRDNLAAAYLDAGRLSDAIRLHEEALAQFEAKLGPDHPDTLICLTNLATAYRSAGRLADAVSKHEEALRRKKVVLGPEHPETLNSMDSLANAYRSVSRLSDAVRLHEETLRLRKAVLGPDHTVTFFSMNNLAVAYRFAGRLSDALPLSEEVLRRRLAKLGPEHPDTLASMDNLGVVYLVAERVSDATPLFEEALRRRRVRLAHDHPETLSNLGNLAAAYRLAGRLADSVRLQEEALRGKQAKLGPDHPETLTTMNNLATAYRDEGRLHDARTLIDEALRRLEAKFGPDHLLTLSVLNNLAATRLAEGRAADAVRVYEEAALRGKRAEILSDHPEALRSTEGLGNAYLAAGDSGRAVPTFRELLAVRERTRPDAWPTFNARSLLGGAFLSEAKYAEAEPLVVSGYEGMKSRAATIPAPAKARLTEAAERVVRLYEAWGKPERAKTWKQKLGLADLPADVFTPP